MRRSACSFGQRLSWRWRFFVALQLAFSPGSIELLPPIGLGFLAGWLGRKLLYDKSLPLIASGLAFCIVVACFIAPKPNFGTDETTKQVFYGALETLLFAGGTLGFLFSERNWAALILSALFSVLAFAALFMIGVTVGCAWFGDCL